MESSSLININEIPCKENIKKSWTPFLRQLMISCGLWVIYFFDGIVTGLPTVLIPQLRREANSTTDISDEMTSWISTLFSAAGLPWLFILPILIQVLGRKIPYILVSIIIIAGFNVLYFSTTIPQILIGEILLGVIITSDYTLLPVSLCEYTSPRYRGLFLTLKSATFYWGLWISNAIGTYFHWKSIILVAIACWCYTVTVLFWPESPHWLAIQNRFEECAKSHRWLRGRDKESERELQNLIKSQKDYTESRVKQKKVFSKDCVLIFLKTFAAPEFYRPFLINSLLNIQYYSSGKLVCSVYAIDIIKHISNDESTAYKVMLILDGVTVLGMYFGCVLAKFLKRRTLLLSSSVIGSSFLCIISLYLYLIKISFIVENTFVTIFFLTVFSVAISCGPMILCTSIYSELIPLRFKSSTVFLIALLNIIVYSVLLKVTPSIIRIWGIHGTFLFFGLTCSILTFSLYKTLPETKDKTLQEIEEHFKNPTVLETKELMPISGAN